MLVELHCHTNYSKGRKVTTEGINSAKECIDYAEKLGLHALAITDHDEIQGALEGIKYAKKLKNDFLVIPGIEVSTSDGHLLVLGVEEKIKAGLSVEETVEIANSLGGITIASHPFDIKNEGIKQKAIKCHALEEFNALNFDRISNFISKSFAKKYEMPTVVGSDAHSKEMIGTCKNKVRNADSVDDVLKAIKKGEVEIHQKRYIPLHIIQEWAIKRLKESEKDVIKYMDENYSKPKKVAGKKMLTLVHKTPGKTDYFIDFLTYLGLVLAVPYSTIKNVPKLKYLI